MADLMVGVAISLGADRKDPNIARLHESFIGNDGCTYQYRLVDNKIEPILVLGSQGNFVSLCPSAGEGLWGGGRSRKVG